MQGFLSKTVALLSLLFLPFAALVAFAMVAFGFALIWLPLGWIVGGILLFLAVLDARRE